MQIKAFLLVGVGILLAPLLLLPDNGKEEHGGPVVLNPDAPKPPRWGLTWDLGPTPPPSGTTAQDAPATIAEEDPPADRRPADPGIWATSAEFAEAE